MKTLLLFFIILPTVLLFRSPLALAEGAAVTGTSVNYGSVLGNVGYNIGTASDVAGAPKAGTDALSIIGKIIGYALGLLGVVLLILSIYAGFLWMTAGGNEEQVTKAKTMLRNAIIGLIITLAAYSIAFFITKNVGTATGGTTTAAPAQ